MNSADSGERYPGTTTRSVARVVLTLYGISLAMIALWPVPVDQGAAGFLQRVGRVLPMLTYPRIEFSANILLFVPLGVLLMLILRRRYLILPIAIAVTVAIECSQATAARQAHPQRARHHRQHGGRMHRHADRRGRRVAARTRGRAHRGA